MGSRSRREVGEPLRRAFETLSADEAAVLWDVLAAFVENERCNDEAVEESAELAIAEALLDRVEAALVEGV